MGWLAGLLSGYMDRSHQIEKENMERAVASNALEAEAYKALLNSPDPKVKAMAGVGILQAAQPRRMKSGLRSFLGEVESNPMYAQLQQYAQTPQITGYEDVEGDEPTAPTAETTAPSGMLAAPPSSAGMPATETTKAGEPGPTATAPTPTPTMPTPQTQGLHPSDLPGYQPMTDTPQFTDSVSVSAAPPPVPTTPPPPSTFPTATPQTTAAKLAQPASARRRAIWGLPQMFPTVEDISYAQKMGQETAEVDSLARVFKRSDPTISDQAAYQQAAELIKAEKSRMGAPRPIAVKLPDGSVRQATFWGGQYLDPDTWTPIAGAQPAPVQSRRAANTNDLIANTLYGQPGETAVQTFERLQREDPEKVANVMKRAQFFIADRPLNAQEKFNDRAKLQDDWMAIAKPYLIQTQQMLRMRDAWAQADADPKKIPGASEEIIVTFEKMLDPNSVVRESEARRPGSMQSYLGRIRGWIDEIHKGGANITMQDLRPYVDLAEGIMARSEEIMAQERQRIEATGVQYGLGELNLLGFQPAPPDPTKPPPNKPVVAAPPEKPPTDVAKPSVTLDTPLTVDLNTGHVKR